MKTESEAWSELRRRAAGRIRPGFADRVLRAARERASPSVLAQFALSAATASLCYVAVALFTAHRAAPAGDDGSGWQEIASAAAADAGLAQ